MMLNSNQPLLAIWGASGHALVVADIVRLQGQFEIVGFLDDVNPERHNTVFCGAPILGGAEQLDVLHQVGVKYLIFGFGDCHARLRLSESVRSKGLRLATAIHPRATVADGVVVEAGTVIAAGAVINPGSHIGANVIVNTCASVDHECIIDDGVHVSPGVHLGARVKVGRGTWIGIGATVADRVRIGAGSIIGAGTVVIDDIPEGVIAYGVPAKAVRGIAPNEH